MKKCSYCAEEIQDEAIVCKHCHRELSTVSSTPAPVTPASPNQSAWRMCPQCGGQVLWISQGTSLAWTLIILGIVLTPFVIGIFIFGIGLYLRMFKTKMVTKCTGCQRVGV